MCTIVQRHDYFVIGNGRFDQMYILYQCFLFILGEPSGL